VAAISTLQDVSTLRHTASTDFTGVGVAFYTRVILDSLLRPPELSLKADATYTTPVSGIMQARCAWPFRLRVSITAALLKLNAGRPFCYQDAKKKRKNNRDH